VCSEHDTTKVFLHYYKVIANVAGPVSILQLCSVFSTTHEKMTLLGSRFLEKGRRSGNLLDVH
jgi:hypothetical protein